MSKRNVSASAFTLIELLVVIAIIALLISILVPSLQNAREQAKTIQCASNQRSLMIAVTMYTDQYDGHFPTGGYGHSGIVNSDREKSWVVQLAEDFGREIKIARCPSDRSELFPDDATRLLQDLGEVPQPTDDEVVRQTSFASQYYTFGEVGHSKFDRQSTIRRPSTTVFLVELSDGRPRQELNDQQNENRRLNSGADHVHPELWHVQNDVRARALEELELDRHVRDANYAFVDGHAERLRFEATLEKAPDYRIFEPKFLTNLYDPEIAQ